MFIVLIVNRSSSYYKPYLPTKRDLNIFQYIIFYGDFNTKFVFTINYIHLSLDYCTF